MTSQHGNRTDRARALRRQPTKSESLLWAMLRSRQLCGLKFRREHAIGPYFADFACVAEQLVVEIDGGYHEVTVESDLQREAYLRRHGWRVLRFSDKDVEEDVEAVGRAIAKELRLEYVFKRRNACGSGMLNENAPGRKN